MRRSRIVAVALLAGALLSGCFFFGTTGGGDACGFATDCASCTARSSCGWCPSSARCLSGSSTGPAGTVCAAGWAWLSSECPGASVVDSGTVLSDSAVPPNDTSSSGTPSTHDRQGAAAYRRAATAHDVRDLCSGDCSFIDDHDLRNFCSGDCSFIDDHDTRDLCLGDCSFIDDHDLRNFCSGDCSFIDDHDLRNFCEGDCSFIDDSTLRNYCTGSCGSI